MFGKKQEQNVGDNSVAIQAGGNVCVSVTQNIPYTEADIERIIRSSISAIKSSFQDQISGLTEDKRFLEKQLEEAIRALANAANKTDESEEFRRKVTDAFEWAQKGNTLQAEKLFLEIEQNELAKIKASTEKVVEAALHRGSLAYMRDTEAALQAYQRVVDLDPENLHAWVQLGYLLLRLGIIDEAERSQTKALNLAKARKDLRLVACAYGALGQVYACSERSKHAMKMFKESLKIKKQIADSFGVAAIHSEIANLYLAKGLFKPAKKTINEAIEMSKQARDLAAVAFCNATLGIIYSSLHEYVEAEKSFKVALQHFENIKNLEGIADCYGNIGILYKNQNNYVKAKEMYEKSLQIETQLKRKRGIAQDLVNLSNLHIHIEEYDIAIDKANLALNMFKDLGFQAGEATAHAALCNAYRCKDMLPEAIKHRKASINIFNSIGNKHEEAKELTNLALIYRDIENNNEAIIYLKLALCKLTGDDDTKLYNFVEKTISEVELQLQMMPTSLLRDSDVG